jgi:pimeloyl-ACP methyl ester carboxylesterase
MTEVREHDIALHSSSGDPVTLRVLEAGDPTDPTLMLCHGFPDLAHSWRHQIPALADAGYHVLAPNQRGYGHSTAPASVDAYGIRHLTGDLLALLDRYGKDDAVFIGHDWGAFIVWDMARLHPERVAAVVGVSVPFVQWPGPPTQLMKMIYTDRFFYILYFQPVGPAETELGTDPRRTMTRTLYRASGAGMAGREMPTDPPPMQGTGFLTNMGEPPALPYVGPEGPWLDEHDMLVYVGEFSHSGYFGPVSYYRNLDANYEVVKDLGPERVAMPSYFIGGSLDPVNLMDPRGIERMQNLLPNFRGATMIDGAGHWMQQEAPDAFNRALLGFLRTL